MTPLETGWQSVPGTSQVRALALVDKPSIFCANTWILDTPERLLVIDPGCGQPRWNRLQSMIPALHCQKAPLGWESADTDAGFNRALTQHLARVAPLEPVHITLDLDPTWTTSFDADALLDALSAILERGISAQRLNWKLCGHAISPLVLRLCLSCVEPPCPRMAPEREALYRERMTHYGGTCDYSDTAPAYVFDLSRSR